MGPYNPDDYGTPAELPDELGPGGDEYEWLSPGDEEDPERPWRWRDHEETDHDD